MFVGPPEIHVAVNVVTIAVCSSSVMNLPSMRHLIGLVTLEFFISLVLSSIEVMNFSVDGGWLSTLRLDVTMFNLAILLMGFAIMVGMMMVEKDLKNIAHNIERSGSFEDE